MRNKDDSIHSHVNRQCLKKNNKQKKVETKIVVLSLPAPCISESFINIKINLNFYFPASLLCLKMFTSKGFMKASFDFLMFSEGSKGNIGKNRVNP